MDFASLHEDERPREKLLRLGPESLSAAELLAVILRTGRQGEELEYFAAFADLSDGSVVPEAGVCLHEYLCIAHAATGVLPDPLLPFVMLDQWLCLRQHAAKLDYAVGDALCVILGLLCKPTKHRDFGAVLSGNFVHLPLSFLCISGRKPL